MNLLDVIIFIPLAWGAYKGFKRGLVFEVFMFIGLVLGLYLAFKFSNLLNGLAAKIAGAESAVIPYLSFILLFAAILLIMILLGKFLEGILKITSLNIFNQVAGAILGLVKFMLAVSVILMLFKKLEPRWNFINDDTKKESLLYDPVSKSSSFLAPALQDIKEEFGKQIERKKDIIPQ